MPVSQRASPSGHHATSAAPTQIAVNPLLPCGMPPAVVYFHSLDTDPQTKAVA